MQGTVPRTRKQGRPKMQWIDNMEKWTGMSFDELVRETRDRGRWSRLLHEATNPWIKDGHEIQVCFKQVLMRVV